MKTIKITPEMAKYFKEQRELSPEPEFKMSGNGECTFGCKVITNTETAVFVHVTSFLDCFGFWMPKEIYNKVKGGYLNVNGLKINYNNTIYRY